jgi:interleukin-1 receptor-associated kinase 4
VNRHAILCQTSALKSALAEQLATATTTLDEQQGIQRALETVLPELNQECEATRQAEAEAKAALEEAQRRFRSAQEKAAKARAEVEAMEARLLAENEKTLTLTQRQARLAVLSREATRAELEATQCWQSLEDRLLGRRSLALLSHEELLELLPLLGYCAWTEPFRQHHVAVTDLIEGTISPRMLATMVAGSGRETFGEAKDFLLILARLERGEGLPLPLVSPATEPEAEPNVERWPAEVVVRHLQAKGLEHFAQCCEREAITGRVLLTLEIADNHDHLHLEGGLPANKAVVTAIEELRLCQAALLRATVDPIARERPGEAVIRALSEGGEPTALPLGFVRRCTDGFSASRLLGTGAFGRVYRGVDPVSGLRFAVKRILDDAMQTPQQRKVAKTSLEHELRVLSSVRHPHMIRLLGYTVPDEQGDLCLVYELGVNGSVSDVLADDTRAATLTWKLRVKAMANLASVLNYMHRSHDPPIFHRDVKSGNLILDQAMEVKLIDCGLARLLSDEQQVERAAGKSLFTMGATAGGALGTPGYMCPRYCRTGKYSEKAEVFSVGIVVTELLLGKTTTREHDLYEAYLDPDEAEEELDIACLDVRAGEWPESLASELIAIATSCVGPVKKRPTMLKLLTSLRALERQYCSPTLEDLQQRMIALQQQGEEKYMALQQQLEDQHRREEAARQAEDAARAAAQRTCCICFCEAPVLEGIECSARADEETPHFTCRDCLSEYVLSESSKDLHDLRKRQARIFCPVKGHGCLVDEPFSVATLAAMLPGPVFAALQQAHHQLTEQGLVQDLEAQVKLLLLKGNIFPLQPMGLWVNRPVLLELTSLCAKPQSKAPLTLLLSSLPMTCSNLK